MRKQGGFTLIEAVIAMIILAGGIIVLGNSMSGSMLAVRKSRQLNTAALLLQRKMTELEIKYEGKPLTEVKEDDAGDFGDDYPEYKWTMKTKKIKVPDMTAALTAQSGGANEMQLMIVKKLTDYIEKSVLELKVTVSRQMAGKNIDYTATTYLVDYSQNLASVSQ